MNKWNGKGTDRGEKFNVKDIRKRDVYTFNIKIRDKKVDNRNFKIIIGNLNV